MIGKHFIETLNKVECDRVLLPRCAKGPRNVLSATHAEEMSVTSQSTARKNQEYLPSATKLRRLCFYTCLSVHRGGVPQCMLGYHTPTDADTPLGADPPQQTATVQSKKTKSNIFMAILDCFR